MALAARRVFARARRRPVSVLAFALLATFALIGYRALKTPAYRATLYYRLAEGGLADPTHAPKPPREIRQYIEKVALSRGNLERIMKKYQISERWLTRDREAAIDSFREEIEVEVSRNYFIYPRRPRDPPRSAQVTISVWGGEVEQTQAILRELGDAVRADQVDQRSARLAADRQLLGERAEQARARTRALQEEIERLGREAARADKRTAVAMKARIAALNVEAAGAIGQTLQLERRARDAGFTGAAEGEQLGLRFELFDEQLVEFAPRLTPSELAVRGAVVLVFLLVAAASFVGAFDDRVYAPEDLVVRGLPPLGALVRFPGDDVDSYRARAAVRRSGR